MREDLDDANDLIEQMQKSFELLDPLKNLANGESNQLLG